MCGCGAHAEVQHLPHTLPGLPYVMPEVIHPDAAAPGEFVTLILLASQVPQQGRGLGTGGSQGGCDSRECNCRQTCSLAAKTYPAAISI